jgi:hypothetical protein
MSGSEAMSVLDSPAAIYRPFTIAETRLLRSFAEGARRLGRMRFWEEVPAQASISFDATTGLEETMTEPSDEALRAAITEFRQLYSPNEPHSFSKVIALLKRSAHECNGTQKAAALEALDEFIAAQRRAMAGIGMGIVLENATSGARSDIDPAKVIDAYLHGHYLHSGNAKSNLARELDEIRVIARLTFYSVMLNLRNLYWMTANVIDRVLAVAALLDTT